MKLAEELIQKAIEGDLSKNDERELQGLLREDPSVARDLENTLEVEHQLRNLDESFDVSLAVMAAVKRASVIRVAKKPEPAAVVDAFVDRWFPKVAVAVTAAAAVIIALVMIKGQPDEPAEIASFEGIVTVTRDGQGKSAGDFSGLRPGDQVAVSKGSQFKLHYDDGTEIKIGSGTEVVFETEAAFEIADVPSKRLELLSGRVEADVSKQPEGHPLVFKTAHAYAIVRGTFFTLQADRYQTRLDVSEGRVDLMNISDGAIVSVAAGEFAIADSGSESRPSPGGSRANDGLVAFYTFQEGEDRTVKDRSGVENPLDLRIESEGARAGTWLLNGGYELANGAALFSQSTADRIVAACQDTGALTLEAWVEPTRMIQGGQAKIVAFSRGSQNVNFLLGQGSAPDSKGETFLSRIRTSTVHNTNTPRFEFEEGVDGSLVHLVVTRNAEGNLTMYRDGVATHRQHLEGDFTNWQEGLKLGLGNDLSESHPWEGALYLVAIYSRALEPDEVQQNFRAGPHQKAAEVR